jgi:hypothetical protein
MLSYAINFVETVVYKSSFVASNNNIEYVEFG